MLKRCFRGPQKQSLWMHRSPSRRDGTKGILCLRRHRLDASPPQMRCEVDIGLARYAHRPGVASLWVKDSCLIRPEPSQEAAAADANLFI